ncbi:MAG: FG-GAP repeat protein [Phycisphaerales bacterium]|nr:MAG: FG-GAP repeat protein [Phycisphaerales bacterium]
MCTRHICSGVLGLCVLVSTGSGPRALAQCEVVKLTASDASARKRFGSSVSISANVALVGAATDDCAAGYDCGAAYVYRRRGTNWIEEAKLRASDAAAHDNFGNWVCADDDIAAVGARRHDCADGSPDCGSVYVLRFDGSRWVEEAKLTASDAAENDQFGQRVAISGDVVLVGAHLDDCEDGSQDCGSVYVYRSNRSGWIEEAKLTASDAAPDDAFGHCISVDGDVVLVGAPYNDCEDGSPNCGSAYVYRRRGNHWVEEAKLTAHDAASDDIFGYSGSLSGDVALMGAGKDDWGDGPFRAGSVYVFRFNRGSWIEEARLNASDAVEDQGFGRSVSIDGDMSVIGAVRDDDACPGQPDCHSGSAYLYRFNGTDWVEEAKLTASDAAAGDMFGIVVSISGDYGLVGTPFDDVAGERTGAGYIFAVDGPDCNSTGAVDICDIIDGASNDANNNGIPDECESIVMLDVRPRSCPNRVNPTSSGMVQMAITGSELLDVREIDIDSLMLTRADGVGGSVAPLTGPPGPGVHVRDVATPFTGELCDCHDLAGDGIDDLVLKFSTREMVEVLELDSQGGAVELALTITGSLLDGAEFSASDCITLVGKGASSILRGRRGSK